MSSPPRRGIVLLAVLVVVVLLTLAAYRFSELMMAEYKAADSYTRSAQAHALADSGIHYAAALLSSPDSVTNVLNNNPYDNTQSFQDVLVQANDQPRFQGRFSVIAAIDPDDPNAGSQSRRFGVTDESGKINLNALLKLDSSGKIAHDVLMLLPNMTESIANSILDWIDADDDPRPDGAESEYYEALSPPYRAKNAVLDSLEELLLVKGVTPQLLFGNDRNRNGILDPDEDDGSGTQDRGWSAYLTVYSREQNVDSTGSARIYINDNNLSSLYQKLQTAVGQDLANYIIAYRLYGSSSQGGAGGGGAGAMAAQAGGNVRMGNPGALGPVVQGAMQGNQRSRPRSISSLFELVNSSVSVTSGGQNVTTPSVTVNLGQGVARIQAVLPTPSTTTMYPSPLNDAGQLQQYLPVMLDKLTTVRDKELPPRINVNTASRTVLSTLPGLNEADVQSIIERRPSLSSSEPPDESFQTPAWLITEANLSPNTLRTLERYITAHTQTYRVQSVGYFDGGGPTARIEAVIDTNGGRPRIVYWRDLTELGKGFDLGTSSNGP